MEWIRLALYYIQLYLFLLICNTSVLLICPAYILYVQYRYIYIYILFL